MPMMGFSLAIASSTSFTDFLRPTSMGMIEFGKRTELRRGRIGRYSGISMGPSGTDFFGGIVWIVVRTEPGCDKFRQRNSSLWGEGLAFSLPRTQRLRRAQS